jgi:hypothetical protein
MAAFAKGLIDARSDRPGAYEAMIAAMVDGMHVSLYSRQLDIATNLWPKIDLHLLGHLDG